MEKKKSKKKWLFISLGIILILATLGGIFAYVKYTSLETIDVFESVILKERGLDGHGELFLSVDEEQEGNAKIVAQLKNDGILSYQMSCDTGLFNGDIVEVTAIYDKATLLKKGLKMSGDKFEYNVKNLLVSDVPWDELPEKEKLMAYMDGVSQNHAADYLSFLQQDARNTVGGNPQVWLDYEFEQAYYGFNNMSIGCDLPYDPQGFMEGGASYDYCGEMLFVYRIKANIEEPYYYPSGGEKFGVFRLGGIFVQDGKLIMGNVEYDETVPLFYVRENLDETLKFNVHFQPVSF